MNTQKYKMQLEGLNRYIVIDENNKNVYGCNFRKSVAQSLVNRKNLEYNIERVAYRNSLNYLGVKNTTDIYIVVDQKGMNITGETHTKKEAQQICKELNNNK